MRKQMILGILLFAGLLAGTARADDSLNRQLIVAVIQGDKAKIETLIASGADVNTKVDNSKDQTPLFSVYSYNVAELLIAKGADVNAKDADGQTPLFWATRKDIAELLIAKGADVNAKDKKGETPLFSESIFGHKDVAELLIAGGADVNAKNNHGDTPLFSAHDKGTAELLIAKGADVNAKNNYGETPLFAANKKDIAELLIAKGADVNAKNSDGRTPSQVVRDAETVASIQAQMVKQSDPKQLLSSLLTKFKGHSSDEALRKFILDLALKQHPPIPAEAEAAAGRGTYIFKNAMSPDEVLDAAKQYLAAIEAAPWVANYYFNLCTVLEKTPYTQQALHACKLYLVAAPDATDAGAVRQRIAGLQYAADKDQAQMKQRTRYIKAANMEDLYRFGGISGSVSGRDVVLKLFVDWGASPPKYQVYAGCIVGGDVYGSTHDLVSSDTWINFCRPVVNLHLVIKPEGEGFVEVSDSNGGDLRATLDELFIAKQKTMAQAVMFSANGDQGDQYYVPYLQGGNDMKHAGFAMYQSDCNGSILKRDPRALPDDFMPADKFAAGDYGRFHAEVDSFPTRPRVNVCASEFAGKTGYHFGEAE